MNKEMFLNLTFTDISQFNSERYCEILDFLKNSSTSDIEEVCFRLLDISPDSSLTKYILKNIEGTYSDELFNTIYERLPHIILMLKFDCDIIKSQEEISKLLLSNREIYYVDSLITKELIKSSIFKSIFNLSDNDKLIKDIHNKYGYSTNYFMSAYFYIKNNYCIDDNFFRNIEEVFKNKAPSLNNLKRDFIPMELISTEEEALVCINHGSEFSASSIFSSIVSLSGLIPSIKMIDVAIKGDSRHSEFKEFEHIVREIYSNSNSFINLKDILNYEKELTYEKELIFL